MQHLDFLRGVALFGVLLVNIFSWLGEPSSKADHAASWAVHFFFESKFWPLFSLLFGLGLAIQLERSAAKGAAFLWAHLRRMAALYLAGLFLIVVLAGNHILVHYALLGTLLPLFRRLLPRTVLICAALVLVYASVVRPLWVMNYRSAPPVAAAQQAANSQSADQRRAGTTRTIFTDAARSLRNAVSLPPRPVLSSAGMAEFLAMLLLGLYLGMVRIHTRLPTLNASLKRVFATGLSVGLAGTIIADRLSDWSALGLTGMIGSNLANVLGGDMLAIGYAAALMLLFNSGRIDGTAHVIAFAGRMPLTNYLAQWFLMRLIFDRYFFGLEGRVGPALGVLIATAIFAALLVFSRWWLHRFRFGPAEWAWKSFAYLRLQPMI